jgi:hypothetical protein
VDAWWINKDNPASRKEMNFILAGPAFFNTRDDSKTSLFNIRINLTNAPRIMHSTVDSMPSDEVIHHLETRGVPLIVDEHPAGGGLDLPTSKSQSDNDEASSFDSVVFMYGMLARVFRELVGSAAMACDQLVLCFTTRY